MPSLWKILVCACSSLSLLGMSEFILHPVEAQEITSLQQLATLLTAAPEKSLLKMQVRFAQELPCANREQILTDLGVWLHGNQHIAHRIKDLDLAENQLGNIPTSLLAAVPNLTWLLVSENTLQSIERTKAPYMPNLAALLASFNKLYTLKPASLTGMPMLRTLFLNYSNISYLPESIFDCVPLLRVLRLTGNNLQSLPAKLFSKTRLLHRLDISENKIRRVSRELLEGLDELQEIFLEANPIDWHASMLPENLLNRYMKREASIKGLTGDALEILAKKLTQRDFIRSELEEILPPAAVEHQLNCISDLMLEPVTDRPVLHHVTHAYVSQSLPEADGSESNIIYTAPNTFVGESSFCFVQHAVQQRKQPYEDRDNGIIDLSARVKVKSLHALLSQENPDYEIDDVPVQDKARRTELLINKAEAQKILDHFAQMYNFKPLTTQELSALRHKTRSSFYSLRQLVELLQNKR